MQWMQANSMQEQGVPPPPMPAAAIAQTAPAPAGGHVHLAACGKECSSGAAPCSLPPPSGWPLFAACWSGPCRLLRQSGMVLSNAQH